MASADKQTQLEIAWKKRSQETERRENRKA